jgi:hypothetical protein
VETVKKELESEAENYGWRVKNNSFSDPVKANELAKSASDDFIAGATSKYVEKQKLEFTIKELMWVNILIPFEHQYAKDCIDNKIKELEQQLSEL